MPKKQVPVTLRKPQAPAEVEAFVEGQNTAVPVPAAPANPIQGAAELGVPLDEHIAFVLAALRPHERVLGLGQP